MRSLLPLTSKAALAAITLVVTVGAAGGAVAMAGLGGGSSGAAEVGHAAPQPLDAGPPVTQATPETTVPPPPTTVAPTVTTTPTTKPAVSGSRTARPPAPTTTVAATSPSAATQTASAPAPLPPTGVARRTPSSTEVQQALKIFPQYVKTFIKPTSGQVAELGDRVCTAFDEGQTFAQVKATGLEMVTQVPKTTVMPGGADWVVRTIVNLYCPGHAPKLV